MPKCEYCGTELEPISFDENGDADCWLCPNDCAFEKARAEIIENEETLSHQELEKIHNHLTDVFESEFPDTKLRDSQCWTFRPDGTRCPGLVERTEETRDAPYGNFCPVCNKSLRYHPKYGQGMPFDLANPRVS